MTPVQTLQSWLVDPSQLADDGLDAPSRDTIRQAIRIAETFEPAGVVVDANGGIVLTKGAEQINVWGDGKAERMRFEGHKVVERTVVE